MISVFIRNDTNAMIDVNYFLAAPIIGYINGTPIFSTVAFRNFAKRRLSVANADVDLHDSTYRRSGFPLKLAALTVRQTFLPPLIQSFSLDLPTR